jgi:hypothetical protein
MAQKVQKVQAAPAAEAVETEAPDSIDSLLGGIDFDTEDETPELDEPEEEVEAPAPVDDDEAADEPLEATESDSDDEVHTSGTPETDEPDDDGEELVITLDDTDYVVEGARIVGESVVIPKSIFESAIRPNLVSRDAVAREYALAESAHVAAKASLDTHPEIVPARVLGSFFTKLMAKSPDDILAVMSNWDAYAGRLKLNVDAEMLRIEREAIAARTEAIESGPRQRQFEQNVSSVVADFAAEYGRTRGVAIDARGASAAAMNELYKSGALTFVAPSDGEFEGQSLRRGQTGLRVSLLENWLGRYAGSTETKRQVSSVAKDVARAVAANTRTSAKKPVPTVSGKGNAPTRPTAALRPKTKEEFEAMLAALGDDE